MGLSLSNPCQNKKRKFGQDQGRDQPDQQENEQKKREEDALKDATTLYVGNL